MLNEKFPVELQKVKFGLSHVVELTHFNGRFQVLQKDPLVIADAAHNPSGVENLMKEVNTLRFDQLHIIFAASSDKDLKGLFNLLPHDALYYFTSFKGERATPLSVLEQIGIEYNLEFTTCKNVSDALRSASTLAQKNDLILIFGSFFLLEDILREY